LAFGILAVLGAARADVVQTRTTRLSGTAALANGHVSIGKTQVPWNDVLTIVRKGPGTWFPVPHAVRLTSGERWAVDIAALSGKTLKVFVPIAGPRDIPLDLVQAIEFLPNLPERDDLKLDTLYREQGEPVPGTLLWIDAERIAINSPLGAIRIKRDGVARYVFRKPNATTPRGDEVHLLDGTILHGAITPEAGGLTLDHAILGKLDVRASLLRAVLRRPEGVQYLADGKPKQVDGTPLIALKPPAPERRQLPRGPELCLNGIAVQPKSVLHYPVQRGTFRTVVGPVDGARGAVKVRIAAQGKALLEKELSPTSAWEPVSVDVPADGDLAVEVDFGPKLQFPCGLVLGDPLVVKK